jgi:hypothetical protein
MYILFIKYNISTAAAAAVVRYRVLYSRRSSFDKKIIIKSINGETAYFINEAKKKNNNTV